MFYIYFIIVKSVNVHIDFFLHLLSGSEMCFTKSQEKLLASCRLALNVRNSELLFLKGRKEGLNEGKRAGMDEWKQGVKKAGNIEHVFRASIERIIIIKRT